MAEATDTTVLDTPDAVMAQLALGGGIAQKERSFIEATLIQLSTRLAKMAPESLQLELSVKDREKNGQKTTLELWLPGEKKMVGTSEQLEMKDALNEVESELLKQINALSKKDPQSNRALRETIRGQ